MALRPLAQRRQSALVLPDQVDDKDPANEGLDEAQQIQQPLRTGQVAQGDDEAIQRIAARLGHRLLEEWDRDPSKWKDHRKFLEEAPDKFDELRARNKELEERSKRSAQAAADAIEDARRQARIEAQAEIRAAAEAQDPERAEKAAQRLAEIPAGPPPQTVAWIAQNPWFETDPLAQSVARAITQRVEKAGGTIDDQLAAATAEIRKRFPEHFPGATREPVREEPRRETPREPAQTEVRLSDSRRVQTAPAVSEGSRGGAGATKEKGWNDVPKAEREIFSQKLERQFVNRGLKPEEARAKWAASYWRNVGE